MFDDFDLGPQCEEYYDEEFAEQMTAYETYLREQEAQDYGCRYSHEYS